MAGDIAAMMYLTGYKCFVRVIELTNPQLQVSSFGRNKTLFGQFPYYKNNF